MNWLDLGIIVFIALFIVYGVKHGLMTSILSNFSLSVNCLISFFLYRPIAFIFNKIFRIGGAIYNSHYASLMAKESAFLSTDLLSVSAENLKDTVNLALNDSGLGFIPKTMFKFFFKNKKDLYDILHNSGYESRTVAEVIAQTYSSFYVTILAFITSVIILYILVFLFQKLANKLRTIGFVKVVDNVFGAFYGLFRCFITLIIICFVIELLSGFAFMSSVINYINGSLIGEFLYNQINVFTRNIIGL